MEDDQDGSVIFEPNFNEKIGETSNLTENNLSSETQDLSLIKCMAGNQSEVNENLNAAFEKDLEFIKKHATNADPTFLHTLLNCHRNNPKRLEVVCEILDLSKALQTLKTSKNDSDNNEQSTNSNDLKECSNQKTKSDSTESYLNQITTMFPDADMQFLISECQHINNLEDFSTFLNTVMIDGFYPKKEAVDYSSQKLSIVENVLYDNSLDSSFEEEISSDSKNNNNKTAGISIDNPKVLKKELCSDLFTYIDLTNSDDGTESPIQKSRIEKSHNNRTLVETQLKDPDCRTFLDDDEDFLFQEKSETDFLEKNKNITLEFINNPNTSSSTLSKPCNSSKLFSPNVNNINYSEKSFTEIVEDKQQNRLLFFEFTRVHPLKPSTSTDKVPEKTKLNSETEIISNIHINGASISKITTTSQNDGSEYFMENFDDNEIDDMSTSQEDWLNKQIANLIRIFPNNDPSYLKEELMKMNMSCEKLNEFVIAQLENNKMPTRSEYEKRLEMEELQNRYTKNFSIEDFLKIVPDPWSYFSEGNRNCSKYKNHSLCYLKSTFRNHSVQDITKIFNKNNFNLFLTHQNLKILIGNLKGKRSEFECNNHRPTTIDIQFLQEVAFIENEEKIKNHILNEEKMRAKKFAEAKSAGTLLECQCCFDSEVLMEDGVYCPKDHIFCKNCVTKSVEIEMGKGIFQFKCLASCDEKFTLACLQNVLKPELFSKIIQVNQTEEIKAAGIEDLVQCPFCTYATIMPPEVKVMTCLNPECLKESCRLCKELNHVPLKCEEVEKSEEVKMRLYIENKMTEALIRTCYKCYRKFVKEDGCNKMTCTCGAKMCYICRQPVIDYSHFNGQGGTAYEKCPLYSTNDELHVDVVRETGEKAKEEILKANPKRKLHHDPTTIMPQRSNDHPMPGMNAGNALNHVLRGVLNERGKNAEMNIIDYGDFHARFQGSV